MQTYFAAKIKMSICGLMLLIPILACNAPINEIIDERNAVRSTPRPTIGPPPTLTPIVLEESEFVFVTLVATPTITPTPTETPTVTPTSDPAAIRELLLATATIDPGFLDQDAVTPVPLQTLSPLRLIYYADWREISDEPEENEENQDGREEEDNALATEPNEPNAPEIMIPAGEIVFAEDVETYKETYEGRLVLEGRGGNGVYAYYINGERLSGQVLLLSMENCEAWNIEITVDSRGSEPFLQEITLKAPCLAP